MRHSNPEETLALHIRAEGLPTPEREHVFAEGRRFRFDFAWPLLKLSVEVDGGVGYSRCSTCGGTGGVFPHSPCGSCRATGRSRGRHVRPAGFERDLEKLNLATLLGWRVLRFTPRMVKSGEAIRVLKQALLGRAA